MTPTMLLCFIYSFSHLLPTFCRPGHASLRLDRSAIEMNTQRWLLEALFYALSCTDPNNKPPPVNVRPEVLLHSFCLLLHHDRVL